MMDFWRGYPIIDDQVSEGEILDLFDGGGQPTYGYTPRDWSEQPEGDGVPTVGSDPQSQIQLIPVSEWDARIEEQDRLQSSLEHLYLSGPGGTPKFVNLDQNGDGYCWMYSVCQAVMMVRLGMNQPVVRLNPHCGAAIIKNGRNEGGWCGLSARWVAENGIAEEGTGPTQWAGHSKAVGRITPALREAMKKYRFTEGFLDLSRRDYDQRMTDQQHASLLLGNTPCASDYDWWGHSVCAIRLVKIEAGSYGRLILNSWLNWGRHGLAVLRGAKGVPNGAVAVRQAVAA